MQKQSPMLNCQQIGDIIMTKVCVRSLKKAASIDSVYDIGVFVDGAGIKNYCVSGGNSRHSGYRYFQTYRGDVPSFLSVQLSDPCNTYNFTKLNNCTQVLNNPFYYKNGKAYYLGFVFEKLFLKGRKKCICPVANSILSARTCNICNGIGFYIEYHLVAEKIEIYTKTKSERYSSCTGSMSDKLKKQAVQRYWNQANLKNF